MNTFTPHPAVAVHPASRSRRLRAFLLALLAAVLGIGSLPHGVAAATVPSVFGTCTFGPTTGTAPLSMTLTASTIDISGYGSCEDTVGPHTIYLILSGYGTYTCAGGAGSMSGQASWTPAPPGAQSALVAPAVAGPGTVSLALTSDTFTGDAQLAWSDLTAMSTCVATGSVTVNLTGTLTYAT